MECANARGAWDGLTCLFELKTKPHPLLRGGDGILILPQLKQDAQE